jgi:hypothetical protein
MDMRTLLKARFPQLVEIYRIIRYGAKFTFSGWGLWTRFATPWDGHGPENIISIRFKSIHTQIKNKITQGLFVPLQFLDYPNPAEVLEDLKWRHFIVLWSAHYALRSTSSSRKIFVECGVCDGLTISFALSAARLEGASFHAYLLDAWDSFNPRQLVKDECVQNYDYLSIESTKINLADFGSQLTFVQGYIPESLRQVEFPENVSWLHIDLNASKPTKDALEFFYGRMEPGAVFLFDDYAGLGYEATRAVIDEFFADKKDCVFMHLPTNNAVAFKVS